MIVGSLSEKVFFSFSISLILASFLASFFSLLLPNTTVNPFGFFLVGMMVFIFSLIVVGGRTYWGDRVLRDIKKQDVSFDPIQRFALYGESTLSGGVLDDLNQIYKDQQEENAAAGCGC